jgi:hypothetical protein
MSRLLRRIVTERRLVLLPIAVALLANAAVYVLLVRPLGVSSEGAEDRAEAAANAVRVAEREHELAEALVTGKARADEELAAFYREVLPANLTAARRITYASLPALARRTNVRYERRRNEIEEVDAARGLGRLVIQMQLQGEYEDVRRFVYELERAPEFLIIEEVVLSERAASEPLSLAITLSTYFRTDAGDR